MTEQKVKDNIIRISEMRIDEVETYRRKISTSSAGMKAKNFLYKACDERIKNIDREQAIVVNGDLDDFN